MAGVDPRQQGRQQRPGTARGSRGSVGLMEHAQYVAAIRRGGRAISRPRRAPRGSTRRCRRARSGRSPICSSHIGRIQHWVTSIVETRPRRPDHNWRMDDPPAPEARIDWFAEGCNALADALARCAPERRGVDVDARSHDRLLVAPHGARGRGAPVRTRRRAAGEPQPDRTRARGRRHPGVFDLMPVRPRRRCARQRRDDPLHCTDGDGEWLAAPRHPTASSSRASTPRAMSPRAGRRPTCCCSSGAAIVPTTSTCSATGGARAVAWSSRASERARRRCGARR